MAGKAATATAAAAAQQQQQQRRAESVGKQKKRDDDDDDDNGDDEEEEGGDEIEQKSFSTSQMRFAILIISSLFLTSYINFVLFRRVWENHDPLLKSQQKQRRRRQEDIRAYFHQDHPHQQQQQQQQDQPGGVEPDDDDAADDDNREEHPMDALHRRYQKKINARKNQNKKFSTHRNSNVKSNRHRIVIHKKKIKKKSIHKKSNKKKKKKKKKPSETFCEAWPLSIKSLPLGPTMTRISDGSARPCRTMMTLLRDTLSLSYRRRSSSTNSKKNLKKYRLQVSNLDYNRKTKKSIPCSTLPNTTFVLMTRVHDSKRYNLFDSIRSCYSERYTKSNRRHPFITIRSLPRPKGHDHTTPKRSMLPTIQPSSDFTTMHGLVDIIHQYLPSCRWNATKQDLLDGPPCIIPQTFRISKHSDECHGFFKFINSTNTTTQQLQQNPTNATLWIKRSMLTAGGSAMERIFHPQIQLQSYASQCDKVDSLSSSSSSSHLQITTLHRNESDDTDPQHRHYVPRNDLRRRHELPPIFVQRYPIPKLLRLDHQHHNPTNDDNDWRSFTIRTYYLYKFPSSTTKSKPFDPAQAWHVHSGNIHLCSEPHKHIYHRELGRYAMQCDGLSWKQNPRLMRDAQRMAAGAISFEDTQKAVSGNIQSSFAFSRPYPQFLQESLRHENLTNNTGEDHHDIDIDATFKLVMKRMDQLFTTFSQILQSFSRDTATHAMPGESSWVILGMDIQLDEHLQPYIVALHSCPSNPLHENYDHFQERRRKTTKTIKKNQTNNDNEDNDDDEEHDFRRNPYLSMVRIILSHYKRKWIRNDHYHENACAKSIQGDDSSSSNNGHDDDENENHESVNELPRVRRVL